MSRVIVEVMADLRVLARRLEQLDAAALAHHVMDSERPSTLRHCDEIQRWILRFSEKLQEGR